MKNAVPILASLILFGLCGSPASAQEAAVTARSGLNLRKGPSVRHVKIGALRYGERVTLLEPFRRAWLRVRSARLGDGWCSGRLLEQRNLRNRISTRGRRGAVGRLIDQDPPPSTPIRPTPITPATPIRPTPITRATVPTSTPSGQPASSRRHLASLNPDLRARVQRVLRRLIARGWQPIVAEGRRTVAQQREKVRLGYSQTMNSKHLTGRAADIVDRRYLWGGPASRQSFQFWTDLGNAARAEGLTWGGDWRSFKDVAHVQR